MSKRLDKIKRFFKGEAHKPDAARSQKLIEEWYKTHPFGLPTAVAMRINELHEKFEADAKELETKQTAEVDPFVKEQDDLKARAKVVSDRQQREREELIRDRMLEELRMLQDWDANKLGTPEEGK